MGKEGGNLQSEVCALSPKTIRNAPARKQVEDIPHLSARERSLGSRMVLERTHLGFGWVILGRSTKTQVHSRLGVFKK